MSSINPVFILLRPWPSAERPWPPAYGSLTLGVGQFCTNPGLTIAANDASLEPFVSKLAELVGGSPGGTMLNPGISDAYDSGANTLGGNDAVDSVAQGESGEGQCQARAALFRTTADAFLADESLGAELFGPSTLVVTHDGTDKMLALARSLEGQLTATVHGRTQTLRPTANCSMFSRRGPASIDQRLPDRRGGLPLDGARRTVPGNVRWTLDPGGSNAIHRFTRAVCYQSFPTRCSPPSCRRPTRLASGAWWTALPPTCPVRSSSCPRTTRRRISARWWSA